jgi:hypothetical protein
LFALLFFSPLQIQLELGGKDPTYVMEDADVVKAAKSLADGAMYNTGQSCCSVERIYVHTSIYKQFVEEFVNEVKTFVVGDPMSEKVFPHEKKKKRFFLSFFSDFDFFFCADVHWSSDNGETTKVFGEPSEGRSVERSHCSDWRKDYPTKRQLVRTNRARQSQPQNG